MKNKIVFHYLSLSLFCNQHLHQQCLVWCVSLHMFEVQEVLASLSHLSQIRQQTHQLVEFVLQILHKIDKIRNEKTVKFFVTEQRFLTTITNEMYLENIFMYYLQQKIYKINPLHHQLLYFRFEIKDGFLLERLVVIMDRRLN